MLCYFGARCVKQSVKGRRVRHECVLKGRRGSRKGCIFFTLFERVVKLSRRMRPELQCMVLDCVGMISMVVVMCDIFANMRGCVCVCVCFSTQAAPPPQKTASACIINQDDWGGKHTGRRSIPPPCMPPLVCVCEFACVCLLALHRQRAGKRFEAKAFQSQS